MNIKNLFKKMIKNEKVEYLNSKWYYRLLKVFYVLFFIVTIISTGFIVFSKTSKELDIKNSYFACVQGGRVSFEEAGGYNSTWDSWNENGWLYKTKESDNSKSLEVEDSETEKNIIALCYKNKTSISNVKNIEEKVEQKVGISYEEMDTLTLNAEASKIINDEEILHYFKNPFYEIRDYYHLNWIKLISLIALFTVMISVLFEFAKRLFYYVVSGSF